MSVCPPRAGLFDGLSPTVLQANLTAAQNALIELQMGKKVATASYAMGDGTRSVTYQPAELGQLTALVRQLQQALGLNAHRRPLRPRYW